MTPSSERHHTPEDFSDQVSVCCDQTFTLLRRRFVAKRYGHRAVVLETVAAVPGMVGGVYSICVLCVAWRAITAGSGTLLDEAENERIHLMTFIHIAKPSRFERLLIVIAQGIFYNLFFLLYLISSRTAHRVVGYFEEEAIYSYTEYLSGVDNGTYANVPAPKIAIDYWKLSPDARLREVIVAVRADEAHHRDVNHQFADELARSA